jgi:hypothetical protein
MTTLNAGSARADITPDFPVMQGGFGQRTTPCTGVHDRIHGKALYLDDGGARVLIVTADLICIPRPLADAVAARIRAASGLAAHEIVVCASHTHSGPVPWDASGTATGVARYTPMLVDALSQAGLEAIARARPSRVRSAVGHSGVFFNRRTRGAPNHVDPRVPALALEDAKSGTWHSVLFGAGCHPVTLGWDNMQISGDFPGFAQRAIERALDVPNALFFNTTEGNVIPVTSPNRDALDPRGYCGGSADDTARIGQTLADEVVRALRDAPVSLRPRLGISRTELSLPPNRAELTGDALRARLADARRTLADYLGAGFETTVTPATLWAAASKVVVERDLAEANMRELMIACCHYLGLLPRLQSGDRPPRSVDVPLQVLVLDRFDLLALPGEVLVEVGDAWREVAGESAFVIGLANAHLRYLPAATHFAEPEAAVRYETVTAGLAAGGVEAALAAAARLRETLPRNVAA